MAKKPKAAIEGGHARFTAGKRTPADEREWTFNNVVVLEVERLLRLSGIDVLRLDDPSGKRDVPLMERTDKANAWGADILVSIHHNAMTGVWGDWTGTETFIHTTNRTEDSKKLADLVHPELLKAYKLADRKVKRANFHMLRMSKMPSILTEGGFMDSKIDILKLRDDAVLKESGKGIAKGIATYFGRSLKTGGNTSGDNTGGTLYRVQVGAFKDFGSVAAYAAKVEKDTGFNTSTPEVDGWMKVQVGAFFTKAFADNRLAAVKKAGYSKAFISTEDTNAVPELEPQNEPTPKPVVKPKPVAKPAPKPKPKPVTIAGATLVKNEIGYFRATSSIKVRSAPSISARTTGTFPVGSSLRYSRVFSGNGYRWLEYRGATSGNLLYIPYRRLSGDTKNWGTFHSTRPR